MEKLADCLQSLADKLGTTVEYVFPKLVEYLMVTAYTNFVVSLTFIVLCLIIIRKTRKKAEWDCGFPDNTAGFVVVTSYLVGSCAFIYFILDVLPTLIRILIVPEGFTIAKLLQMVQ